MQGRRTRRSAYHRGPLAFEDGPPVAGGYMPTSMRGSHEVGSISQWGDHSMDSHRRLRARRLLPVALLALGLLLMPRCAVASPDDFWDASFYANGTNVGGTVNAVAVSVGNVYVGGNYTSIFGVKANNIARWDGTTWSALSSGVTAYYNTVYALAVSGSDLYVGGGFTTAGGTPAKSIAKWDGTGWCASGNGLNGTKVSVAVSGSIVDPCGGGRRVAFVGGRREQQV